MVNVYCDNLKNTESLTSFLKSISLGRQSKLSLTITNSANTIKDLFTLNPWTLHVNLQLYKLSLTGNNLTLINFTSPLWFTKLESLDLSDNYLRFINLPFTKSLLSLNVSKNLLQEINLQNLTKSYPNLKEIDFSNNLISKLEEDFYFQLKNTLIESLFLNNNPWDCDTLQPMLLIENEEKFKNKVEMKCEKPLNKKGMNLNQLIAVVQSKICSICDCRINSKQALSVNCTNKGFKTFPQSLPVNTRVVILDRNKIENALSVHHFDIGWQNVSHLYLRSNNLSGLESLEMGKILKKLFVLDLRGNKLREIPYHILDQLSHLEVLYLGDNPWNCDCNAITFQSWLQKHFKFIRDMNNIHCDNILKIGSSQKRKALFQISVTDLCPQPSRTIEYLDIVSAIFALLTTLILLKLAYDWYWQKRTGKLPTFFKINH